MDNMGFKVKNVIVNNNEYKINSPAELQEFFISLDSVEYKEFSIDGDDETSLLVLMNRNYSLCIYFTDMQGGESYHIYNPAGNPEKYETFILSNGQADEYEETMLVSNKTAYHIMLHYFDTGMKYDKVIWIVD